MRLSIIIPLYNEENTIIKVLNRIQESSIKTKTTSIEIIVIDDNSTDNSFSLVENIIPIYPFELILFKQVKNKGKGAAIRKGLSIAKGDVVLLQDADLELFPEDVPQMITAMQNLEVSFINGSRYMPGLIRPLNSYRRYLGNAFFSWLTSIIVDVKITDMACGYKLIRKDLLDQLPLKENRFGIEAEIILKTMRMKKNTIAEVPVRYLPRNLGNGKKLAGKDVWRVLWTIIKIGILRIN